MVERTGLSPAVVDTDYALQKVIKTHEDQSSTRNNKFLRFEVAEVLQPSSDDGSDGEDLFESSSDGTEMLA